METLEVNAPPTGVAAPPGYCYLVVNRKTDQGPVPSVARMVHVGTTSDTSEAPQPFPDDPTAPAGGSATPDADTSAGTKTVQQLGNAARSAPVALLTGRRRRRAALRRDATRPDCSACLTLMSLA